MSGGTMSYYDYPFTFNQSAPPIPLSPCQLSPEVLLYHVVESTTLYSAGMRHSMTFSTSDTTAYFDCQVSPANETQGSAQYRVEQLFPFII